MQVAAEIRGRCWRWHIPLYTNSESS